MGNNHSRIKYTQLNVPFKLTSYLNNKNICSTQTTRIQPAILPTGKIAKKPLHQWNRYRADPGDDAIMIMTGRILVIDIDDPVDDINKYVKLPEDCWVDYTPSGGCHIYIQNDDKIREYNTTIGLSLWGFDNVDILIKRGFAYAGGTTYTHPVTGALMVYRWDTKKNPATITTPGKIPKEWKDDILDALRNKNSSYVDKIRPYILGCTGNDITCLGCKGLVGNEKPTYYLYIISTILKDTIEGDKIIREWISRRDFKSDFYDNIMDSIHSENKYVIASLYLSIVKKDSSHGKLLEKNSFLRGIINGIDLKRYLNDEDSFYAMVEFIKREGGSRIVAEEFALKVDTNFNISNLIW